MVAKQNRVPPSPFDLGLLTFDLDLDCDNYVKSFQMLKECKVSVNLSFFFFEIGYIVLCEKQFPHQFNFVFRGSFRC